MPCSDVSENIRLVLDHQDRITYYALAKDTCSGAVGKPSLLKKWIKNRAVDEILAATPDMLSQVFPTKSETWQFLYAKHLFAVQRTLQAALGYDTGRPSDYCAVHSVTYTPDGVEIIARLNIGLMTAEIKACGNCGCS